MTISDQIRNAIRSAGRPLTCGEVRAAVPGSAPTLMTMARGGYLTRSGESGSYTYAIAREVRPWGHTLTEEERKQRRNEREKRRYASLTMEQRRELMARKSRKPSPKPTRAQHIAITPSTHRKPESVKPRMESVSDYLKRGGRIERLPMHAVSQPLRRIA